MGALLAGVFCGVLKRWGISIDPSRSPGTMEDDHVGITHGAVASWRFPRIGSAMVSFCCEVERTDMCVWGNEEIGDGKREKEKG